MSLLARGAVPKALPWGGGSRARFWEICEMTRTSRSVQAGPGCLRAAICLVVGFHLISLTLTPRLAAYAGELSLGIVTTGAFLVHDSEGNGHFQRKAYLPVGTIVEIVGEEQAIPEWDEEIEDFVEYRYSPVKSQSGMNGLLRTDLRVPIGDYPILVPIDPRARIPYYFEQPQQSGKADCDNDKNCIYFARDNKVHLELLEHESDEKYYRVVLHRNAPAAGQPDEEPAGWLKRSQVAVGHVKRVDGLSASSAFASWEQTDYADEEAIPITKSISEDSGVEDLRILCDLEIVTEADAGFKIFGFGVAVAADARLKKQNMMRLKERYDLRRDQGVEEFLLYRDIKCDDTLGDPERMLKLTLQKESGDDFVRKEIFFEDIEKLSCQSSDNEENKCSTWLRVSDDNRTFDRMMIVDGWDSYNHLYQAVKELFEGKKKRFAKIDEESMQQNINDKQILYDFLLQEIAVFAE